MNWWLCRLRSGRLLELVFDDVEAAHRRACGSLMKMNRRGQDAEELAAWSPRRSPHEDLVFEECRRGAPALLRSPPWPETWAYPSNFRR